MKNILLSLVLLSSSLSFAGWEYDILNKRLLKNFIQRETCTICCEKITSKLTLSCKHSFGEECILEWFERNSSCPICRCDQAVFYNVELLKSNNLDFQKKAVGTLLILMSDNQVVKNEIRRAGAIPIILGLLKSHDNTMRASSAAAISRLAFCNSKNKKFIIASGAIAEIINLLESEHELTVANATGALLRLCGSSLKNQNPDYKCDLNYQLLSLLASKNHRIKINVVLAMEILERYKVTNEQMLRKVGAIKILLHILESKDFEVRERSAMSLRKIALNSRENQNEMVTIINLNEDLKDKIQYKYPDLYNTLFNE